MTIRTNVKAGGIDGQHNETLAVRSNANAGGGLILVAHPRAKIRGVSVLLVGGR